jgi:hypothetical protein
MFDRGHDQVASDAVASRERAGDSGVDRPCAGGGEHQLVRAAADRLRGGLAGGVQEEPRPPSLPVETGRVRPPLVQGGLKGLAGHGMERGGGCGVEVGHDLTLCGLVR